MLPRCGFAFEDFLRAQLIKSTKVVSKPTQTYMDVDLVRAHLPSYRNVMVLFRLIC